MKLKKFVTVALALCLSLGTMGAFAGCSDGGAYELPHYDGAGKDKQFTSSELFYRNTLTMFGADPSIIYVSDPESEDYGWFYLYPTSDFDFNVSAFSAYRSRNMVDWEFMGAAFTPEAGSWAKSHLFAPEVVYEESTKKYYMFFSAKGYDRDDLYFDTEEELIAYRTLRDELKGKNLNELTTEFNEYKSQLGESGAAEGYTEEQAERVRSLIADFESRRPNLEAAGQDVTPVIRDTLLKTKLVKLSYKTVTNGYSLGIAVSDSPRGPFVQYRNVKGEEGYDPEKRELGLGKPWITHEDFYENCTGEAKEGLQSVMSMIDAHAFEGPDGDKYVYFSSTRPSQEYIYGLKIGKDWTDDPEWNTTRPLVRHCYKTVDGTERTDYMEDRGRPIDEGPFVYYDEGSKTYFLTFSVNGCFQKNYCVAQAVSDSPLGPFTKIDRSKGGFVISSDPSWDHVGGTGHHCFIKYDGKLYIGYQSLYRSKYGGDGDGSGKSRGVSVDEVKVITNLDGQTILYANGPSKGPMPLIGEDARYENIAGQAEVGISGKSDATGKELLTDGLITYSNYHDIVKEFELKQGKTTVTLTFEDYRTIRAIQVFNSKNLDKSFRKIDRIELDFTGSDKDGNQITETACIKVLSYYVERYSSHWNGELADVARPGGSVCVEFNELKVKEIRIIFKTDAPANISEIFVLGK